MEKQYLRYERQNPYNINYIQKVNGNKKYEGITCRQDSASNLACSYSNTLFATTGIKNHGQLFYYSSFKYKIVHKLRSNWQKINIANDNHDFCAEVYNDEEQISHNFMIGYYIMINIRCCKIYVKCDNINKYIGEIDKDIIEELSHDYTLSNVLKLGEFDIINIGKRFTLKTLQNVNKGHLSYITLLWLEKEKKKFWQEICGKILSAIKQEEDM